MAGVTGDGRHWSEGDPDLRALRLSSFSHLSFCRAGRLRGAPPRGLDHDPSTYTWRRELKSDRFFERFFCGVPYVIGYEDNTIKDFWSSKGNLRGKSRDETG